MPADEVTDEQRGYDLAEVYADDCDRDEAEANARLIAAAPDLLAVAQRILDRGYVCPSIEEEADDHAMLRAAITKATESERG